MNFKVTEGDNWNTLPLEDIINDYTSDTIKVVDIKEKYNLTRAEWNRIRSYMKSEGIHMKRLIK